MGFLIETQELNLEVDTYKVTFNSHHMGFLIETPFVTSFQSQPSTFNSHHMGFLIETRSSKA